MAKLISNHISIMFGATFLIATSSCGLVIDLPPISDGPSGGASLGGSGPAGAGSATLFGGSVGGAGGDSSASSGGEAGSVGTAGADGGQPGDGGRQGAGGNDSGGAPGAGGAHSGGSGGSDEPGAGGTPSGGSGGSDTGSGGCANTCNCDSDPVDGPQCGGDDCDDDDPDVFPGQTKFFSTPADNDAIGYDYDCSEEIERPQNQVALTCSALSLTKCDDYQGFLGSLPACGASASWGGCIQATLACKKDVLDPEKVATCH